MAENLGSKFRWLHLTDLHAGLKGHGWLWPTFQFQFMEDITRLHEQVGSWDVVVFSGDFTQKGAAEEFNFVTDVIGKLWERFDKLGFAPKLLLTPGNHDLVRPPDDDPEFLVLTRWWQNENIHDQFFKGGRYIDYVQEVFSSYKSWVNQNDIAKLLMPGFREGLLPGDMSATIESSLGKIGFVALNSTWLQLGKGDFKGLLHVDPRQLFAVTANRPDEWASSNAFNILTTHQPQGWLSERSLQIWLSEIFLPKRFDMHMFGHMHEPFAINQAIGGSKPRTSLQSPSLFGLEFTAESERRIQGYTLCEVSILDGSKTVKVWPRSLRQLMDGQNRLGPDSKYDLGPDGSINLLSSKSDGLFTPRSEKPGRPHTSALIETASEIIERYRYYIAATPAHRAVRKIEQKSAQNAINSDGIFWLIAEWGMGADPFTAGVIANAEAAEVKTFLVNFEDETESDALVALNKRIEGGFHRFCEVISKVGTSCVIFEDLHVGQNVSPGIQTFEEKLEKLLLIAREYSPETIFVVRARRAPIDPKLTVINLQPLDLPDLKIYIESHERGSEKLSDAKNVALMHRHTDGIPIRVDTALKELEVSSPSDVLDIARSNLIVENSSEKSKALRSAVSELMTSSDPSLRRSFLLLKSLSVLPQGDQLERVKRLASNSQPFFPPHATILLDRSLIESVFPAGIPVASDKGRGPTLRVPRLVRECVQQDMKQIELASLNRKAADLYFGSTWSSGQLKRDPNYHFDDPRRSTSDIANASEIIKRLYNNASVASNDRLKASVINLIQAYTTELSDGSHYQATVNLFDDLFPRLLSSEDSAAVARLKVKYGRALRMTSQHDRAIKELEGADKNELSASANQHRLLNLAFAHKAKGELLAAVATAKQIIEIEKNSSASLQAKAILLESDDKDDQRGQKLRKLEAVARRRKAFTVANNIAIYLVENHLIPQEDAEAEISKVLEKSRGRDDFYNRVRAIISLCEMCDSQSASLTEVQILGLVEAYNYLFNEGLSSLFNKCNKVLWKHFEDKNDTGSLLVLFRQSSFVWRLKDDLKREAEYAQRLGKKVGNTVAGDIRRLAREAAYYLVRMTALFSAKQAPQRKY